MTFSWHLLVNTFVPAALGGPWHWAPPSGVSGSWTLYAIASPPPELLGVSWILAALVVIISLWYRRRAWPAWTILLGWLVVVDIVPILLGRLAIFGTQLADETIYVADAAPVLAICLAIAYLPLRGEQDAYRTAPPPARPRTVAVCAVAVAFIASSVSSAIAYRGALHPQTPGRIWPQPARRWPACPPDTVIYPTQVPGQLASPLFGQLSEVQNALAPLANQVPGQRFRWVSSPTGVVKHFMIFDAQGQLDPADGPGPALVPVPPPQGLPAHRRRHAAAAHRPTSTRCRC